MTESGFDIRFDEALNALVFRVYGLWDAAKMAAFQATVFAQFEKLKARTRTWDVFGDASQFPVQSPPIADAFNTLFIRGREINTGHTAILVTSMLGKMQVERSIGHDRLRVFLDRQEAVAWLKEKRAAMELC